MLSETELKKMMEAEDHAHFMAGIVEESPESFTADELEAILDEMIESKVAIEDNMREDFAKLDEVSQTKLLDSLGASGYRDRDWWYRMRMDGPVHRDRPTI